MNPDALRAYAEPAILRDGGSVMIRAVSPSDKGLVRELFAQMSSESVRLRTFHTKSAITDRELSYLTELDFTNHVALAAVHTEGDAEHFLAVGRFVRLAERTSAEVAFAVADAHQGRGIGTVLLEHLARIARGSAIDRFEAEVLAENTRMLDVFVNSGFTIEKSNAEGIYHVAFSTDATEELARASALREHRAAVESVRVFFEPASVAVLGASRREGSIGRAIVRNLLRSGFRGPIYPVNPAATTIEELRAFPSLAAIGERVDLAIVTVPARAVPDAVATCASAGVRGVVVISSGFAESSPDGRRAEIRLRDAVRGAGMRMVGPNCMGVLNASPAAPLNATFAPTWPPAGNVSMVSQSGALGIAMLDYAAHLNLGIAGFVSVGNKADVSSNDLLAYWADDPRTDVIALYLESFGNPRKFARVAPEVARKKPIVAVKSGRSTAGTRAAASHSAALASLDVGVDALFAQAGVIRTSTLEELFDAVALLSTQPLPRGPRVAVVTNAGGPGILLADACEAHGLVLPGLGATTLEQLRAFLPPQASLSNPIDMIASASADHYARAITAVGQDPAVDALVVIYIPPLVTQPEEIAAAIARAAATLPAGKPIATVFMSSKGAPPVLSTGPRGKIPSYSFPENAALALAAASRYARWRERPRGHVHRLARNAEASIRAIVTALTTAGTATPGTPLTTAGTATPGTPLWVPPAQVAEILAFAGIPLARSITVPPDPRMCAAAGSRLGYPVVVKAIAPSLLHKSDAGGVILGLASDAAVNEAVRVLADRMRVAGHTLDGILVQEQVTDGLEAIVGVTTDPSLGPLLVAGLGGVQVELLRDVALRLTPVSDLDAAEMLASLRASKLLDGFRGAPAADRAALLAIIESVSALVEAVPELVELELNPIKVRAPGAGAVAVDARIRLAAP